MDTLGKGVTEDPTGVTQDRPRYLSTAGVCETCNFCNSIDGVHHLLMDVSASLADGYY